MSQDNPLGSNWVKQEPLSRATLEGLALGMMSAAAKEGDLQALASYVQTPQAFGLSQPDLEMLYEVTRDIQQEQGNDHLPPLDQLAHLASLQQPPKLDNLQQ